MQLKASLYIALAGVLYGFSGYLGIRAMEAHLAVESMLFVRFMIAGIWIAFFIPKKAWEHMKTACTPFDFSHILLLSAFGYAASLVAYFLSSQMIGTGLAKVIYFSYPLWVALGSWIFYKKAMTLWTGLTLLAMLVGLLLLNGLSFHHSVNRVGVIWGLISAITWASYMMSAGRYVARKVDGQLLALVICVGAAIGLGVGAWIQNSLFWAASPQIWGNLILQGLLTTAIPIQLVLMGLKEISALRASILSVTEPVVTVLVGVLLLHEVLSGQQILGAILLITSAILIQFQRNL